MSDLPVVRQEISLVSSLSLAIDERGQSPDVNRGSEGLYQTLVPNESEPLKRRNTDGDLPKDKGSRKIGIINSV